MFCHAALHKDRLKNNWRLWTLKVSTLLLWAQFNRLNSSLSYCWKISENMDPCLPLEVERNSWNYLFNTTEVYTKWALLFERDLSTLLTGNQAGFKPFGQHVSHFQEHSFWFGLISGLLFCIGYWKVYVRINTWFYLVILGPLSWGPQAGADCALKSASGSTAMLAFWMKIRLHFMSNYYRNRVDSKEFANLVWQPCNILIFWFHVNIICLNMQTIHASLLEVMSENRNGVSVRSRVREDDPVETFKPLIKNRRSPMGGDALRSCIVTAMSELMSGGQDISNVPSE